MKISKNEEMQKTTLRLPRSIWRAAKIRAIDEGRDFQDVVADALKTYLKTKLTKAKGRD